jgi:hypothetical protein
MGGEGMTSADCVAAAEPLDLAAVGKHRARFDQELGAAKEANTDAGLRDWILSMLLRVTTPGSEPSRFVSKDRINACASILSPLIVAAVVILGLASICAENLSGSVGARQFRNDHSAAIQKLLFRP